MRQNQTEMKFQNVADGFKCDAGEGINMGGIASDGELAGGGLSRMVRLPIDKTTLGRIRCKWAAGNAGHQT